MKNTFAAALFVALAASPPLRAGVETTEPRPTEDRFFTVVLSEEERARFELLSEEERGEFRAEHWARLDPTPTTVINEREMEHQRRVVEALRRFRDISGFFAWDDRARALIRFGEPESERKVEREGGSPAILWLYGDRALLFEAAAGEGTYRVVPWAAEGEGDPDAFPGEVFREAGLDPAEGRRLVGAGIELWAGVPERNEFAPEAGRPVGFIADSWAFAGAGGKTDVLIALFIPDSSSTREGARIDLRRRTALRDTRLAIIAREEDRVRPGGVGGDPAGGFVTVDSLVVPPGEYQLVIRIDGAGADRRETRFLDIRAPDYAAPGIRVAGPMAAGKASTSFREKGLYERQGHRIVPRPGGRFAAGETAHFYFEVVGVEPDRDGRYYMEIAYGLEGPPGEWTAPFEGTDGGRLGPGRTETAGIVLRGPLSGRHVSLDTAGLPAGEYRLWVEARDRTTERSDRASAEFTIGG